MTASLITGLIPFFCLLLLGSADPQTQNVTALHGDDVTLLCQAPNNVNIAVVRWSRSDLKKLVFLKSDGHLKTAYQDPSYVNRVQLEDDEMKNGDLSLILKNVTNNDEGTYVCSFKEEEGGDEMKPISFVYLDVRDPPITAHPGGDVTLPCKAPNNINITAVEWIRSDLDPEKYVYLKSDGRLQTAYQDPSYVNRVQLEDDEMKNGDLSLILKNVKNNDEGRYECSCVEKTGRRRKRSDQSKVISIVYLKVEGGDSRDGKDKHGHLEVILSVSLIAALVAVGLVIYKKLKGRSEKKPDLPVDDSDVL